MALIFPTRPATDIEAITSLCGQVEAANLLVDGMAISREAGQLTAQVTADFLHNQTDIADPTAHLRKRLANVLPAMAAAYRLYRERVKAKYEFAECAPHLLGRRFLDYGSGGGVFASLLQDRGFDVQTADVIDWRSEQSDGVPFTHLKRPDRIPFPDKTFDTTFVYSVLHHIDAENLSGVLNELRRVSKRIIVKEDIIGARFNSPFNCGPVNGDDPLLAQLSDLSLADQFTFTAVRDWFSNVIKGGVDDINMPFAYRTLEDWLAILARHSFLVRHVKLNGFNKTHDFKNSICHGLIVADAA